MASNPFQSVYKVSNPKAKASTKKEVNPSSKGRIRQKRQFTLSSQAIERLKRLAGPNGNMSATIERLILSK